MLNFPSYIIPDINLIIGLTGNKGQQNFIQDIILSFPEFSKVKFLPLTPSLTSETPSKQSSSFSILSTKWISSFLTTPISILFFFDITNLIDNQIPLDNIIYIILEDILIHTKSFPSIPFLFIIFNLSSNFNVLLNIKSKLKTMNNMINDNNLFLYDSNSFNSINVFNPLKKALYDNINLYLIRKIEKYQQKQQNLNNSILIAKNLIKEAFFLKAWNDNAKKGEKLYKAYNIFTNEIHCDKFLNANVNVNEIRMLYLKYRNICDYIIVNILQNNFLSRNDILNIIKYHFDMFDYDKCFKNRNEIKSQEMKLFYYIWLFKWYEYINNINEEMKKDFEWILNMIHMLIRICRIVEDNKELIERLMIYNEEVYLIEEKFEIGKMQIFGRNDKGKINEEDLILLNISYEIKNQFKDFAYFKETVIEYVKMIYDFDNESITNNNSLISFAISLLNEKYPVFLKEKEKYFLHLLIYSKQFLLKKFPLIHKFFLEKYTSLLISTSSISELNSFHYQGLLNNILQLLTYRQLNIKEKELLNELFLLNTNKTHLNISGESILSIKYEFNNKYINRFSSVLLTVNIYLTIDYIKINNIEKILIIFSNPKKNHSYTGINYSLEHSTPLSLSLNVLINENDENFLELKEITIMLQNNISIRKQIYHNNETNIPLIITDNPRSEKVQLLYNKDPIQVSINEYHVYKIEIIKNDSSIETAITSIIGLFGVCRKDINDYESHHDYYQFIYKHPKTNELTIIKDYLSINIKPDKDKNTIMFILQITEKGKFLLNFNINITLSFLQFTNSSDINTITIQKTGIIEISIIKPIEVNTYIKSNYYMIDELKNPENKIYQIGKPICVNYIFKNNLPYDIHLSNLQLFPSNQNISVQTNLIKLLQRNKISVIKSKCNFNIPFIIHSNEIFNNSPGKFEIQWHTPQLKSYTNNTKYNCIICNFPILTIDKFIIDISTIQKENSLSISLYNTSPFLLSLLLKIQNTNTHIITGKTTQRIGIFPKMKLDIPFPNNSIITYPNNSIKQIPDIHIEIQIPYNIKSNDDKPHFIIHSNNIYSS